MRNQSAQRQYEQATVRESKTARIENSESTDRCGGAREIGKDQGEEGGEGKQLKQPRSLQWQRKGQ
jgi:hypothetical protein